jgi:hypothetical protein
MEGRAPPAEVATSFHRPDAQAGFRQLKAAGLVGLLGQILIWGSAIALWVVGSLYSPIRISTKIAYGANGLSISAGAVFALNYALIAGAAVALLSFVLFARSFQRLAKATPPLKAHTVVSLTTVGIVGLGMFALGWAIWLGSFVAPGVGPSANSSAYTPVLASNLADLVDLLLVTGGLLAFGGTVGIALESSKVGTTYDESFIELGGALSMLPVFSIVGYLLSLIGLGHAGRKLERGWTPPPPPPPPTYPSAIYSPGYAAGPTIVVPGRQPSWDSVAVVLIVVLVLLWVFLLPISLLLVSIGPTYGPAGTPGGGGNVSASPALGSSSPVVPLLLIGLAATAVLLPLAISRNRRKRQREATQSIAPPPPPPPPPPPRAREGDPLDHLV